jgi:hypothetical protein
MDCVVEEAKQQSAGLVEANTIFKKAKAQRILLCDGLLYYKKRSAFCKVAQGKDDDDEDDAIRLTQDGQIHHGVFIQHCQHDMAYLVCENTIPPRLSFFERGPFESKKHKDDYCPPIYFLNSRLSVHVYLAVFRDRFL